jgi:hypothetical protein
LYILIFISEIKNINLSPTFQFQKQKKILKLMRDTVEEKRESPESRRGDLLDRLIDDMKSDNLSTENLISYVVFVLLFATSGRSPQLQVWPSSYWQSMLLLCKN